MRATNLARWVVLTILIFISPAFGVKNYTTRPIPELLAGADAVVVGYAGSAGKVDVMAHSLGNLVVWEAARLLFNQGTLASIEGGQGQAV